MSHIPESGAHSAKDEAWADGIRRLHESGGGVFDVYLLDAKSAARLLTDATRGDPRAARLFGAVLETGKPGAGVMSDIAFPSNRRGLSAEA
jgi:hypothetical protein